LRFSCAFLAVALLLAGCATRDEGRARLLVPSEIGAVYSEAELQAQLALTSDAACPAEGCAATESFRDRVRRLGERLIAAAAALPRETGGVSPRFAVDAPGKDDIGTLSSASGSIVVFDGVRMLDLTDPALAFLIAREMGHVIGRHHEENTASGLAVSVAVAILFPVTGILQGVEAAYAASTLATTATSFAGARAVRAFYRDDQQREADLHAMLILARAGWTPHDVARALHAAAPRFGGDGWLAELRASKHWLDAIVAGPPFEEPAPSPVAVVEVSPDRFGPSYDADTLWIAALLYGTPGLENFCPARLPAPAVETAKPAKKKAKRKAKKKKGKKKPPAGRARKPRVRSR
jgi:hypothetical protein